MVLAKGDSPSPPLVNQGNPPVWTPRDPTPVGRVMRVMGRGVLGRMDVGSYKEWLL